MNRIDTWILKIYIKSILNPFIFNNDLRRGGMSKKNLLYTKVIFGFMKIGGNIYIYIYIYIYIIFYSKLVLFILNYQENI